MTEKESQAIENILKIINEDLDHPEDVFVSFNIVEIPTNIISSNNVGPISKLKRNEMLFTLLSAIKFSDEDYIEALVSFVDFSEKVIKGEITRNKKGDFLCQESRKS